MREIANQAHAQMPAITDADIANLVHVMKTTYGRQYLNQWPEFTDQEVFSAFKTGLQGISKADFDHGCEQLKREAWPPNVPAFRNMCEQGGTWLTQNEAWVTALEFSSNPNHPITEQAKKAFDAVRHVLAQEGQKAAANAFKDVYQRIVSDCRANNITQSKYIAPVAIQHVESTGKRAPMPANVRAELAGLVARARA